MAVIKTLIRLCLGLQIAFTGAPALAEIPMVASFERMAIITKKRFCIEAVREMESGTNHAQNVHSLNMLSELLANKNSPPDFVLALKLALPNAAIAVTDPDIIRVLDKKLTPKMLEVFDLSVKISDYSGRVGDLLSSISLEKRTLMLDQVIHFPAYP